MTEFTVFVLSLLVGYEVISKVPATLHTPLMSAANAIHGIVLVGAALIAVTADTPLGYALAFLAVALAAVNVVGGYAVTNRMLAMFRPRPPSGRERQDQPSGRERQDQPSGRERPGIKEPR